jgi:hypothetical protein
VSAIDHLFTILYNSDKALHTHLCGKTRSPSLANQSVGIAGVYERKPACHQLKGEHSQRKDIHLQHTHTVKWKAHTMLHCFNLIVRVQ